MGAFALAADSRDGIWLSLTDGHLARYYQGHADIFPLERVTKAAGLYNMFVGSNSTP